MHSFSQRWLILTSVVLLVLAGAVAALSAQSTPADIEARLQGQSLYLRGQWYGEKLQVRADGTAAEDYKVLPFSVSGIDVLSVEQKGDVLEIEGQRMGLAIDRNGVMTRVKLNDKYLKGHVTLDIEGSPGADFLPALAVVFAELGDLVPQMPDYWQSYARSHFPSERKGLFSTTLTARSLQAPDQKLTTMLATSATQSTSATPPSRSPVSDMTDSNSSADNKALHIGGSIKPPRVVKSVDPSFTEAARTAKFSGAVEVYLWVEPDGTPTHIRLVRPAGLGLDENAVAAVSQYKFKPATRDGVPVRVDLYIAVNFTLF